MANSIEVARVQHYSANVNLIYQQKASKLRKIGRVEYVVGKTAFFERIAPSEALQKTVRHSEQSIVDTIHSRRMAVLNDYYWNDYIDKEDKLKMLIDPQSPYAQNAASSLGRRLDRTIIEAALGTAATGENGTGTQAVLNTIAHGGTGFTLAKIIEAATKLNTNEVPMEGRYMVMGSTGLEDLLGITQLTSADYNSVKMLTTGEMGSNTFMGFEWILYNMAAVSSTYTGFACHKDAIGIAMAQDVQTRIDQLPTKHYTTQVYASTSFGAVRIMEEGVIPIEYQ